MIGFIIFIVVVMGIAGVVSYFYLQKKEQASIREIKDYLIKRITDGREINYNHASNLFQTSEKKIYKAAKNVFTDYYRKYISDGIITDKEEKNLGVLIERLGLDSRDVNMIYDIEGKSKLRNVLKEKIKDGELDEGEIAELDMLRKELGFSKGEATDALRKDLKIFMKAKFSEAAADLDITDDEILEIDNIAAKMGIPVSEARQELKKDVIGVVRKRIAFCFEDQEIYKDEAEDLSKIMKLFGVSGKQLEKFGSDIRYLLDLTNIKKGNLPRVSASRMLSAHEVCHLDCQCIHTTLGYATENTYRGTLLVTNKRVLFDSAERGFDFKLQNILDVSTIRKDVFISLKRILGNGFYRVSDQARFVAIILGACLKANWHRGSGFSSERSRHIPQHVKTEVWSRGNGACVYCGANDYLHFDHIIPFSKGGSNTAENIQILCAKCNLEKSDRI
ncbi:MAG: hypothetical protein E3J72_01885 [Planctomycetota bacterium]|nr:MAG: hypothetical protein E3J72_01885 [Planctomycetota bacterium]